MLRQFFRKCVELPLLMIRSWRKWFISTWLLMPRIILILPLWLLIPSRKIVSIPRRKSGDLPWGICVLSNLLIMSIMLFLWSGTFSPIMSPMSRRLPLWDCLKCSMLSQNRSLGMKISSILSLNLSRILTIWSPWMPLWLWIRFWSQKVVFLWVPSCTSTWSGGWNNIRNGSKHASWRSCIATTWTSKTIRNVMRYWAYYGTS